MSSLLLINNLYRYFKCAGRNELTGVCSPLRLGYTYAVVLNDHTAAVLPVLTTDKNIDVRGPIPTREGPHARLNKAVYNDCKFWVRLCSKKSKAVLTGKFG